MELALWNSSLLRIFTISQCAYYYRDFFFYVVVSDDNDVGGNSGYAIFQFWCDNGVGKLVGDKRFVITRETLFYMRLMIYWPRGGQ